ncbi:MAG: CarD family transcriptional regulator [Butyrivibrio sp.]|jgi:CarD family transcriptional regulator|uniref:Transcriptional regulator, CarD family n=1 Tax=Butyrivibrio hungatei TaxID=185008 RepID=A0A1G5BSH6_9FIRM|nr:CarD family transcriptional regulator [Butyrivibrio hungatei]MBR4358443.1 CarD family transcriptional regulator [Butyrivibrio sp.]MBR4639411.1 CarD family transcriptional regulator [Butyrivibrio sp.]MCR4997113.1 CarD family transcriptional regulator [Butyrivibrio sp.]SCX92994.1 transcriptional regulator, CarD family [Butyrivibrio hungatei]
MLNVGDCVIYGSHGLCKVRDILVPAFLEKGNEKQYYMMVSAVDAGSVIYVPVEGAEDKVRDVMSADDAEELICEIEDVDELDLPDGKKAEPEITGIIKRNIADEMMSLVKSLHKIKAMREAEGKKFAALNEKYLNMAEKLLYTEMAFSLKTEKETIKDRVIEVLSGLPLETI